MNNQVQENATIVTETINPEVTEVTEATQDELTDSATEETSDTADIEENNEVERSSPTLRPLRLYEMLRYDNMRHAKHTQEQSPDANARVLTRKPRSVWNLG